MKSVYSIKSYPSLIGYSCKLPPLYIGSVSGRGFFPVINRVKSPPSPKYDKK